MTEPAAVPPPEEKAKVEAMVAACIEALERGEPDPATVVCAERPDLLPRVQRRLAQLAARGLIPGTDQLPAAIGPYRVLREIGSGGMGHVYLAEQVSPVKRRVALKVIKLGMDTREVVARFQVERQALALMNHPHIAQVFDAGITSEGRPYFVMEYVGGLMLNAFCDRRQLATGERVRLLATVCRAVQHAHDRGFLHRDLKPSNILVSEHEGEFAPKIIDFGIAKAIATPGSPAPEGGDEASRLTRVDQVLGTPEFMSPEQMRSAGADIDTRTDVYSLGVTLYESLCGELPFDGKRLRSASRHELERILQDELPTQPSKRIAQASEKTVQARGGERSTVQRTIAGELDWITLKALAKRREHRYPSALAFAEDLERWLRHEPVLAAPPGRGYRLRKFVRRHRVSVAAAAAVLLSLCIGLVVSLMATSEAIAARNRESQALGDMRVFFDLARDAVANLVDVAGDQLAEVPQAGPVRQRLLGDAMGFYAALRARQPGDPELRLERLVAIARIGQLQHRTGASQDAVATFEQCIADGRAMLAERPGTAAVHALLLDTTSQLATTLTSLGRDDEAKRAMFAALDLLAAARAMPAAGADFDLQEAKLLGNLALAHDGDNVRAMALFERSLATFERAAANRPDVERERAKVAVHHAEALTRANRLDEATAVLLATSQRLAALPAATAVEAREEDAALHQRLAGVLRRLDRRSEARAAQERALGVWAGLASEHRDVPSYADNEAAGWYFLAQLRETDAMLGDARAAIGRAVAIREGLVARNPQNHRFAMFLARSLLLQADLEMQASQREGLDRAVPFATLGRAIAIVDPLQQAHPDDADVELTHGAIHGACGAFATTERRWADAAREHRLVRDAARARLATRDGDATVHYQLAMAGNNLMQVWLLAQDPAAAVADGEDGLRHLERGLALDARHEQLRLLIPTLLGRLSSARFAAGDVAGSVAMLQAMQNDPGWGADARECGCLLLAQTVAKTTDEADHERWCMQLIGDLRQCIATRGSLRDALARPPQEDGFSRHGSSLRDFDLRVALGSVLELVERRDEQAPVLDEATQILATLPKVGAGKVRNYYRQCVDLALGRNDPAGAKATLDTLLARFGPHGGMNYPAAALLAKVCAATPAGAERDAIAATAVACLERALADREVPKAALDQDDFTCLRARADFQALRDQ